MIFYGDAGGIRPAMLDMGQKLANAGFVVLLPDLFYRYGPYKTLVPEEVFKGGVMAILGPVMATTGSDKAAQETEAFLAYVDGRSDVAGGEVGAVGFCMGGGLALASAATYPTRFAAVASYHGGHLATDEATSPHLIAPQLKAEAYIASAENDDSYPPAMAERLEKALAEGGARYQAENYAGAAHGWMVPDFPSFDAAPAERGWMKMVALLNRNLQT